jgi:uncharacterized protein (TIGR03435 family)
MTYAFAGTSLIALAAGALLAQTAAPAPVFEVASIKPAVAGTPVRMQATKGRLDFSNVSLKDIVAQAYKLPRNQVKAPDWMDGERFDITAKIPEGVVAKEQVPAMLQALLAERFKLKVHRETKEETVYALVVAKGGPKLKKAEDAGAVKLGSDGKPRPAGPGIVNMSMSGSTTVHVEMRGATMTSLAEFLSNQLRRPVVDETAITGNYDIDLDASVMDQPGGTASGPNEAGPPPPPQVPSMALGAAIQKLGLKLEPRKGRAEYLIVDSAAKAPAEN